MFDRVGQILASLTPGFRKRKREVEYADGDPDYWFSDIDSREGTPEWFDPDEADIETSMQAAVVPYNAVPALDPKDNSLYLSRLRLWCCQCLHLSNYLKGFTLNEEESSYKNWPCQWCYENLPRIHHFCENCALIRITTTRVEALKRCVWNRQALHVFQHPMYSRGGVGEHGPQFYLVECCKKDCKGVFRVDWSDTQRKLDPGGKTRDEGIWVDFGQWLCPECGQRGCKYCLKLEVATQVITGGERSQGWIMSDAAEDVLNEKDYKVREAQHAAFDKMNHDFEREYEKRKTEVQQVIAGVTQGRAPRKGKAPAQVVDTADADILQLEKEEDVRLPREDPPFHYTFSKAPEPEASSSKVDVKGKGKAKEGS